MSKVSAVMFLKKMHGQSQRWFVKIFLGILGSSFALWGIGDIVRNWTTHRPIATIDKANVSYEELAHMINQESNRIIQLSKGKLDPAALRQMGLHEQVLQRLINEKALIMFFKKMNMTASDALIRETIRTNPAFQRDGIYMGEMLRERLKENGISEAKFFAEIKQMIFMQQMGGAFAPSMALPRVYMDTLINALTEKHTYVAATFPIASVMLTKPVSDDDVKLHFEKSKESYRVPEYRAAQILVFDQKVLSASIPLTEMEVSDRYKSSLADFTQPERRVVAKLTYPSRAAAVDALTHLRKGRLMTAVARDIAGGTYDDVGLVEKEHLPEAVQKTVFETEASKYTDVIENGGMFSIYHVKRIDALKVQPLAEVRTKVEDELRLQKYADHFQEIRNNVEDALAAGKKLAEVAQSLKLTAVLLPAFDQMGMTRDGADALASLPKTVKTALIEQTFALNEGTDSRIIDVSQKYAFIVHVDRVTPSAIPVFEVIKDAVKKDFELVQKRQVALKLASQMVSDAKTEKELAHQLKTVDATLSKPYTIRRIDTDLKEFKESETGAFFKQMPMPLLQKIFTLTPGKAISGEVLDNQVMVIMLQKAEADVTDKKIKEKLKANLKKMSESDIMPLLTLIARNRADVWVNQEEIVRLVNRGVNEGD